MTLKNALSTACCTAAIALLALAGCGLGGEGSPTGNVETTAAPEAADSDAAETPSGDQNDDDDAADDPAAQWPTPADAAELTGPASSVEIPDVVPLEGAAEPDFPVTITDDRGEEITIESADRVLALDIYGTLSDITLGLGLGDRLIGRTVSDENDSMAHLPNITVSGHTLNAEAIMELEPDLILHDTTLGPREVLEQLEASGIPVVYFTPDRELGGVDDLMRDVSETLGVPERGEDLISRFHADLEEAGAYIDHLAAATTDPLAGAVLYVRGQAGVFFIMSQDNGVDDLMANLDLTDAATEAGIEGLQPANAEALAELDPDLILVMTGGLESTGGVDGLLDRPGVGQTTAGQNERIIDAPDSQLLSFGPRSPQSLMALAEAIYLEDPSEDSVFENNGTSQ